MGNTECVTSTTEDEVQLGWYHVSAQVLAAAGVPLVYLWVNMAPRA